MHVEDGFTDHLAVWVSFRRHSWGWGGSYVCVDGTVLGPYLGIVKRLQEQPYQRGGGVLSIPFLRCIGTIGLIFMNAVRKTLAPIQFPTYNHLHVRPEEIRRLTGLSSSCSGLAWI